MAKLTKKFPAANNMARGGPNVDDESAVLVATGGGEGEGVYRSLDPLDPRRVSMDIFELYCQEMLVTDFVGRRAYLINKMRVSIYTRTMLFFWGGMIRLDKSDYTWGQDIMS